MCHKGGGLVSNSVRAAICGDGFAASAIQNLEADFMQLQKVV